MQSRETCFYTFLYSPVDLSLFIHIPPPPPSLACTFYIAYNTQFHENLACSFFRRHFFFFFFFISIFLLSLSRPIDFPLPAFISFLSRSPMLPVMNVQLPSLVNRWKFRRWTYVGRCLCCVEFIRLSTNGIE